VGHVVRIGTKLNGYGQMVGKLKEKRPLKTLSSCKDNIKMNLKKTVLETVDWIHLAEDVEQWLAVVNTMVDIWVSWRKRFIDQ